MTGAELPTMSSSPKQSQHSNTLTENI